MFPPPAPGGPRPRRQLLNSPCNMPLSTVKRDYLAGVATHHLNRVAGLAAGFIITPFALGFLTRQDYGLYALVMSVVSWLSVCDFGFAAGLQTRLSRDRGRQGGGDSGVIRSGIIMQGAAALVVLMTGILLAWGAPFLLGTAVEMEKTARGLLLILAGGFALETASRAFTAILVSREKLQVIHSIQLAGLTVRTATVLLLLTKGWGVFSLGAAYGAGAVVRLLLLVAMSARYRPRIRLRTGDFSPRAALEVGRLGLWFSVGGAAGILILGMDRLLAAKLVSLEAVAVLYLTGRLYEAAESMLRPLTDTARPLLGRLLGSADRKNATRIFFELQPLNRAGTLLAAAGIWAANRSFVTAWVGAENYGGWGLDLALAAAFVARMWVLPDRAFLSAALVVKPQALVRLGEGVLNFALSVLWGLAFGLMGIVAATPAAALATSCRQLPRLTRQVLDGRATASTAIPYRLAFALLAAAAGGRWLASQTGGFHGAAAAAVAVALIAGSAFWVFLPAEGAKRQIRGLFFRGADA